VVRDKSQENVIYAEKDDSMLIIAPPGYGKTYTMARRIEYLIKNKKLDGNRKILGLTYSNAAASEMYKKLDIQDPGLRKRVKIINYHAFCYNILRTSGNKIGLSLDFSIISKIERDKSLRNILLQIGIQEKDISLYLKKLNDWIFKKKILRLATEIGGQYTSKIENAYNLYVQNLIKKDKIDFDLIIEKVIELWDKFPDILDLYRRKYQYLIIDEFQDTNHLQYEIIKRLIEGDESADPNDNKTKAFQCYCDPLQSIYVFQGALAEKYKIIVEDFEPKLLRLGNNYRTNSKLIQDICLQLREDHKIPNDTGETVKCYIFDNQERESKYVVKSVKNLVEENIRLEDICIIARTYERLNYIKSLLEKGDINYIYLKDFRSEVIEEKFNKLFLTFDEMIRKKVILGKIIDIYDDICEKYDYNKEDIVIKTIHDYMLRYEKDSRFRGFKLWQKAQIIKNDIRLELNWGIIVRENIKDKVFLSVVHQVKGLEFKHVFFIGMENYGFPLGWMCFNKCVKKLKQDLTEETNIFYVGVSRAISKLVFTSSKKVIRKGQKKKTALNCFINKIDNFIRFIDHSTRNTINYKDIKCWSLK